MKIGNISSVQMPKLLPKQDAGKIDFGEALNGYIKNTNHLENVSKTEKSAIISGKSDNISKTVLDIQKASIQMQLTMAIRNKLVNAYQEIMRMQI